MKATNLKKATSPDNVSPRDLWQVGDSTTHSPLLINKSLSNSTFPSNWNLSNVNPIFKKGSPTDVKNFRPLCSPSLFLERSQKMLFEITPYTNTWRHMACQVIDSGYFGRTTLQRACYFPYQKYGKVLWMMVEKWVCFLSISGKPLKQ